MPASPPRILVVEDDARVRAELVDALLKEGTEVDVATDLAGATRALGTHYDLVILDRGLPDGDGLEICRSLRARGRALPVLIVSSLGVPEERVAGLEAGADDYVVKPYHLPEVLARVRGILRRTGRLAGGAQVRHLDLWLDPARVSAGRGDVRFHLKPREFDLLAFLMRNPGKAWSRSELLDQVWGHEFRGDERTVDLHVRRLRTQIEPRPADPRYIQTVWGTGYRMAESLPQGADRP